MSKLSNKLSKMNEKLVKNAYLVTNLVLNIQKISEFMALGCTGQKEAAIALQVYLELCEVKKYLEVEYQYNNVLEQIYFTARRSKSDRISFFIPKSVNEELNFNKMKSCFVLSQESRVFLVLVACDSTCVYYQISDGLFEPVDPSGKQFKGNKQEKIDADIRKNRKLLEEAALCGVGVTLKDEAKS